MNHLLLQIKGKAIDAIDANDGLYISFGDSYLAIHNPVTIEPDEMAKHFSAMAGLVIEDIQETESEMRIQISGNVTLRVDLRPEAYTGPEAMVLKTAKDGFVIW